MVIIESPKMITVSYSNLQIPVTVWFEERNRLSITVQPDKSIVAKAPLDHSLDEVQAKLEKRASWMAQQLEYFDQYHPILPERQYVSGETHYYLGRQYRLKVMAGSENDVKLIGKYFVLTTTQPENLERKQQILQDWYTRHAKVFIQNRSELFVDRLIELGARTPEIKYRRMNKRWGSCTPSGVITFNTELIKAPTHCIDYVVLHDVLMPDWKKRKERLEKVILV